MSQKKEQMALGTSSAAVRRTPAGRHAQQSLLRLFLGALCLFAGVPCEVRAEQEIGKVVALRGSAAIERGGTRLTAAVNSGILPTDVIKTAGDGRVKMRFIDDSVLTVGENSRLAIKEFFYSKEKGGRSIFNLLDGKMHSVVGKTKFEVQTPTAIAAARGTVIYFEVGEGDVKP